MSNNIANAIRVLAADAVEKANSGHPGMPMGMAEIAEVLWKRHLSYNPKNPNWVNRDRVVISNGHGSMLLYAVNYLTGYDLSLDDIKSFRQLDSVTAGHPELDVKLGIETTTGPLGQGISNAVGMAVAEKHIGSLFNTQEHSLINHFTYVLLGDGCLMEGISHEVCSLAGTLSLGKLIMLYDDNGISIDGDVTGWFTDITALRFESYGWQVIRDVDGHDHESIDVAIREAKSDLNRPTLICCKTLIGKGAPGKQGKSSSHGAPLGQSEIDALKSSISWGDEAFYLPPEILEAWDHTNEGHQAEAEWNRMVSGYEQLHPAKYQELRERLSCKLPDEWVHIKSSMYLSVTAKAESKATRVASQDVLETLYNHIPFLFGGSADLTGSNNTFTSKSSIFLPSQPKGNYLEYGVREFGMAGIMNGLALYGGFIPFGGTFLVFSDYSRNALRMSALMKQRTIHVLTHDSIGLGEDGPTHQPIEHLSSLRSIPNMNVWRPCDTSETLAAWISAVENISGPTSIALSRQALPFQERTKDQLDLIARGGYILYNSAKKADVILVATGSEISIAMDAAKIIENEDYGVRVVSMPCMDLFYQQDIEYQENTIPKSVYKITIEAGSSMSWWRVVGDNGHILSIDEFGASAPAEQLYKKFNLTSEKVVEIFKKSLINI
jgi:transketolase